MEREGTLIEWHDAGGYGFIAPQPGGGRLFVHISAFKNRVRPLEGDRIRFSVGPGRDGRPSAVEAQVLGVAAPAKADAAPHYFERHALRVWAAVTLIALIFAVAIFDRGPIWLAALYATMGALSFAAYGLDKKAARAGDWRISEAGLHTVDAAFGIVGGLLAQQVLRHKTSKPGFAFATGGIAFLHGLVLIGVLAGALSLNDLAG